MRTQLPDERPPLAYERRGRGRRRVVLPAAVSSLAACAAGLTFSLPSGSAPGGISLPGLRGLRSGERLASPAGCGAGGGGGRLQPRAQRAALPEDADLLVQQLGDLVGDGPAAGEALRHWAEAQAAALPDLALPDLVPPAYAADGGMPAEVPKLNPDVKYLYGADGQVLVDPMSKNPLVDDWWNSFVGFQADLVRGLDRGLRNLGLKEAFGWTVLLYTLFIKVLLYPTIAPTIRSGAIQKMLTPKLNALKEKYKDNDKALMQRQLRIYEAFSCNPLGGCLPSLLQFPAIFALYSIWRRLCAEKFEHYAESWLWVPSLAQPNPEWNMQLDWLFAFDGSVPIVGWSEYLRYLILPAVMISYTIYNSFIKPKLADPKETPWTSPLPWFLLALISWIGLELPQVALIYYTTNLLSTSALEQVALMEVRKEFPLLEVFEKTGEFPEGNFDEVVLGPDTLHEACQKGNMVFVSSLLEEGQDVNGVDEDGATPVFYAVVGGHLPVLPVLALQGADLTARDSRGNSLLHVATMTGRLEVLKYLVTFLTTAEKVKEDEWLTWTNGGGISVLDLALRAGGDIAEYARSHAGAGAAVAAGAEAGAEAAAAPMLPQTPAEVAVLMLMQRMGPGAPRPTPEAVGTLLGACGIAPTEENLRGALQFAAGPGAPPPSAEQLAAAAEAAAASPAVTVSAQESIPAATTATPSGSGAGAPVLATAGAGGSGGGMASARAVD